MPTTSPTIHAGWLRAIHWLNALAVLMLVLSGWKIYNATAFLGFAIPGEITLGGWLGGALLWHFAAMWLFGVNGVLYLFLNVVSGRFKTKFFPLSVHTLWADVLDALRGKLAHTDPRHYNMVQRLAYLFVMLDGVVLVASGLVLFKSVQFPLLRELLGGYEGARLVHFFAMATLVLFVVVYMVRGR